MARSLPEEWEDQTIAWAFGGLDQEDLAAALADLPGNEAVRVRQTVAAYRAAVDAVADAVAPAMPPPALRARLVAMVAADAEREARQFELAASLVASTAALVFPPASVKDRLLARLEGRTDLQRAVSGSVPDLNQVSADAAWSRRAMFAWRHLFVTLGVSLRLCWSALLNLLRTIPIRSMVSGGRASAVPTAAEVRRHGQDGLAFIKAVEGDWREIAPGVAAKALAFDTVSRRATALLRFAPGTRYPPHRHAEVEELYVLQGGCSIAGREMGVGDYHRADAGTEHHETSTAEGCVLLVISSPQNQMLS
ncbi:MAG: cupin domain-containing protein [Nitrospira sp.]|nr:cupin domain-containing protein [Nitrospira sp.]